MTYEGALGREQLLHGWIGATQMGIRLGREQVIDLARSPRGVNDVMEFGHVVYSPGTGDKLYSLGGIWAPVYVAFSDEHGGYLEPVPEGDQFLKWDLMHGYTGQHGYRGPWMHESEYIGARMAEDILNTAGIYVAVYPSILDNEGEEINPDTWAVAYISENIPGSVP